MFNYQYKKPLVVAEIGCNHMGKFEIAIELIDIAKCSGATCVKFQKRNIKELLTPEQYEMPHPEEHQAFMQPYGKHREYLEFSVEQHARLKEYCDQIGIDYSCSAWDLTSAKELISFNPKFIKVPSASNNNMELLKELRDNYAGDIHISLGMTTKSEELNLIEFLDGHLHRVVLYSCTSGYPVPEKDLFLLEIKRLWDLYGNKLQAIGFSSHNSGIAMDIAAYTLGATWFERHFTKDRTWKGTDQAASLEPQGLQKLIRDLNGAHSALLYKPVEILEIEEPQRFKLKNRK